MNAFSYILVLLESTGLFSDNLRVPEFEKKKKKRKKA